MDIQQFRKVYFCFNFIFVLVFEVYLSVKYNLYKYIILVFYFVVNKVVCGIVWKVIDNFKLLECFYWGFVFVMKKIVFVFFMFMLLF